MNSSTTQSRSNMRSKGFQGYYTSPVYPTIINSQRQNEQLNEYYV